MCNHGVTFDVVEASKILASTPERSSGDPAVDFVVGASNGSALIRKRWPRLFGKCPLGCGFDGIAYASFEHMLYGDW